MKRKARMRRLRRDELEELLEEQAEHDEQKERSPAAKTPAADGPVKKTLELQKTAGNRAVGEALSRWSVPFLPQATTPTWPKSPELLFDDEDPIPLDSFQDANVDRPLGGPGSGRQERDEDPNGPGEFVVYIPLGKWSSGLQQTVIKGKHYTKVQLVIPGRDGKGMRWILHDVYIAGVQMSQGGQSLQLSFKRREFSKAPPPR
jgi:hypothetical protein